MPWPFKTSLNTRSTGCVPDSPDERDLTYGEAFDGVEIDPIDWVKGYDVEKELNIELKKENQNGSWSCFPAETKILTEGFLYRKISDITIGDIVCTHLGNWKRVTQIFKRKWQGTMNEMKLWGDYRSIISTKEHPFFVIKRTTSLSNSAKEYNGFPDFYQSNQLKKGDWVAMPINDFVKDCTVYSFEKDPDFLWVLGLYLAEGSIDKYGVIFSLHKKETDYYEKIKQTMSKYGANTTCHFKKDDNGMIVNLFGAKWAEIFKSLGGEMCDKKRLNKRLMFLNPALQMKIAEGYIAGDGCITSSPTVTIVSTSYNLLIQIRLILLRNRIFSSLQIRKKRKNRKQVWVLEYSLAGSRYSFFKDSWCFVLIKLINHIKSYAGGHIYNIEVEDDNSYQVNGVAVHNCVGQSVSKLFEIKLVERFGKDKWQDMSARWVYANVSLGYKRGASLRDGIKWVADNGNATEKEIPSYEHGNPPKEDFMLYKGDITNSIVIGAKKLDYFTYRTFTMATIEDFAHAILEHKGLVMGFAGSNEGWATGTVRPPKDGEIIWGHSVLATQFGEDAGGKWIGGLNWWGTNWGHNGYWKSYDNMYFNKSMSGVFNPWILVWDSYLTPQVKIMDFLKKYNKKLIQNTSTGEIGMIKNGTLLVASAKRAAQLALTVMIENDLGVGITGEMWKSIQNKKDF